MFHSLTMAAALGKIFGQTRHHDHGIRPRHEQLRHDYQPEALAAGPPIIAVAPPAAMSRGAPR
jgi:hypothetical protein